MSRGRVRSSWPFGPSTFTVPGASVTLTLSGSVIGSFPMRDNCLLPLSLQGEGRGEGDQSSFHLLPDVRQNFAAEALAQRLAAAHDPFAGAQDRDAEPAEDSRNLRLARVDAQSGAADPLDARDHANAIGAGLEDDTHRLCGAVGLDLEARDVALVLQHARDLELQPRRRHPHLGVARAARVANAREH